MKTYIGLLLSIVLSFFVMKPLFSGGYFPMHDDTQVARVVEMGRALKQGQFPVRWVSDLGYGYGYPLFNFYGPLPYYAGGGLYALGVANLTATKAMFGLGALLATVFFYLFAEPMFGWIGAIVGTLLFVYAPYHAVQIYIRGSVGEYWAIAFVPLMLAGLYRIVSTRSRPVGVILAALGLAGAILSHTILGFLTAGFFAAGIIVYTLITFINHREDTQVIKKLIMTFVLGIGLSAFFWLPAYFEMGFTGVIRMISGAPSGFMDHFVCPNQLWDSPWGFGGSATGCTDGMSFKLGKLQIVVAALGILTWLFSLRKKKKNVIAFGFMGLSVTVLFLSVLGMLDVSRQLWSLIPYSDFIQYPWRLLSFSIIAMGICGSFFVSQVRKPLIRIIVALGIIVLCLLMNGKLFQPKYQYSRDPKDFETIQELRFTVSKTSDEYLPPGINKPMNVRNIVYTPIPDSASLRVQILRDSGTYLALSLRSSKLQPIVIQRAYFPGWVYFLNGKKVSPAIARGLPSVVVWEGKSILEARLTNTPVRIWGNFISISSFIVLGFLVYYGKKIDA